MQRITNQTTQTQTFSRRRENSPENITQKLERTRAEVRRAITDVQAVEGRFLDYETAEAIQRALVSAARHLEELTITLAVMERKVRR
jgi:hypothetical protein